MKTPFTLMAGAMIAAGLVAAAAIVWMGRPLLGFDLGAAVTLVVGGLLLWGLGNAINLLRLTRSELRRLRKAETPPWLREPSRAHQAAAAAAPQAAAAEAVREDVGEQPMVTAEVQKPEAPGEAQPDAVPGPQPADTPEPKPDTPEAPAPEMPAPEMPEPEAPVPEAPVPEAPVPETMDVEAPEPEKTEPAQDVPVEEPMGLAEEHAEPPPETVEPVEPRQDETDQPPEPAETHAEPEPAEAVPAQPEPAQPEAALPKLAIEPDETDEAPEAAPEEGVELYVVEQRMFRGKPARVLSDGTIEAETDEGWMRFEDFDHLREYTDAMAAMRAGRRGGPF